MFCEQCGAKNNDEAKFCSSCGNKISSVDSNAFHNKQSNSDILVLVNKLEGTNGTPGFITKKRRLEIYSDHLRIIEVDKDPNRIVAPIKFTYSEIKEIDYATPSIWAHGKLIVVPNSQLKVKEYYSGIKGDFPFSIYWTDKTQNKIADEIFQYIKSKISNLYGNLYDVSASKKIERIVYSDEKTKEIQDRSTIVTNKLVKIGYELSEEKLDTEQTYWKLIYKSNGSYCEFNSIEELEAFAKNF